MKSSSTFALLGEMTGASYLISMVFKICHPKPPGAGTLSGWKPCLEHMQRCSGLLVAFSLSLVFVYKGELPGHLEGVCGLEVVLPGGMNIVSCLISMVFKTCHPKPRGAGVSSG